jgi:hypothetical protein
VRSFGILRAVEWQFVTDLSGQSVHPKRTVSFSRGTSLHGVFFGKDAVEDAVFCVF